jgi:hypothetical protein
LGPGIETAPHRAHEHENGFQALLAINDIVNQNAFLLAFVQENGRERVISQNTLNELGAIALVPNRLALEAGLQVQVPMFVKVLEVEDALGGGFVGDGGVSEHKD